MGVYKGHCVFISYLAFLVLSGFFTLDVAFATYDNLATLFYSYPTRG